MRPLVLTLVLAAAAFAAGVFWTRTGTPATPPAAAAAPGWDDAALAALRKDNQLLRDELAMLANELAALRTSLQDRPGPTGTAATAPAQADVADLPATKPAKDALERYRAATGNPKPADPAELVPYFTDPQQAEAFLKNRGAAAAKPERQQLKAELKTELKQRLKAGADPAP